MAEKSVETLVEEISTLQNELEQIKNVKENLETQLANAREQAKAIEAIKKLAESFGVSYEAENNSAEYWESLLSVVVLEINQRAEADLEELTTYAEEKIAEEQRLIGVKDEEISALQAQIATLEKEAQQNTNELNRLKKKEKELEEIKAKLVEVRESREKINKNYKALSREKSKLEKLIKKLEEGNAALTAQIETLTAQNASLKVFSTGNIYTEIEAMIADVFIKHGYKVAPHAITGDNTKENDRQYQLYKAIKAAKKLDKKAEKKAKGGEPNYDANGYNTIEKELIEKYNEILAKYIMVNPEIVKNFIQQYATEADRQDGKVTEEEMVRTILDREQSKGGFIGFIKSTSGKAVTLATALVVAATLVLAGSANQAKVDAENKLGETETTLSETVDILEKTEEDLYETEAERDQAQEDKEKAEEDKIKAEQEKELAEQERDDAKEELNKKDEEIQGIIEGFIAGDMVTVNVSTEEFTTYKSLLKPASGGIVRGIQSCQYNKETGKVEILLNCVASNRQQVTDYVTFTMNMSNVSSNIKDGTSILDFASIMDLMQASTDFQRTSYNTLDNAVSNGANSAMASTSASETAKAYTSFSVAQRNSMTTITCQILVVKYDENGKVIDVDTFAKSKTVVGTVDLSAEKDNLLSAYLTELGISTSEVEIEIQ